MAYQFQFPDVGEGIHEGKLVKWKVKVGDVIKEDAALADVETAKALVEIPSPRSGTILQLHFSEGQTLHVGDVLVTIGEAGDKVAVSQSQQIQKQTTPIAQKQVPVPSPQITPLVVQKPLSVPSGIQAVPAARKRAQELGIDLAKIKGTGLNGIITIADVEGTAKQPALPAPEKTSGPSVGFDKFGRVMHMPLTGIRKATAENMALSKQTIPHVTHLDEVDITALEALRQSKKEFAENKGIHLTMLPFIMKAVAGVVKKFPYLNGSFDSEKQEILVKEYYHFGFAVDTAQGLFVPVITSVDTRSIMEIAKKIEILATHCKERDISSSDLQGATFTFTNIGSYGGIAATPIIPPGTAAILGIYRMKEKPVVRDGIIVIRKILPLSITFDHRVVDGGVAAQFMNELVKHLEDPELFVVDV
ncbi:2-oxo acid dehydrogenase subunit E2 [Candidatus Woesearchaeota archaeon]|nr:2-oxo acid dehydrogenase subunit E2 [Candidatus Woesearchaeota archaeon]